MVERPTEIVITYLDLNGKRHEEVVSGLKARIFQHETDHLNGIIFTDYIDDIEELEVEDGYELPEALVKNSSKHENWFF